LFKLEGFRFQNNIPEALKFGPGRLYFYLEATQSFVELAPLRFDSIFHTIRHK